MLQKLIKKIEDHCYIFMRFKFGVSVLAIFDQFQRHHLLAKHLLQFFCEFNRLLDGYNCILCTMLNQKWRSVWPDIGFGIGSADSFRDLSYFLAE